MIKKRNFVFGQICLFENSTPLDLLMYFEDNFIDRKMSRNRRSHPRFSISMRNWFSRINSDLPRPRSTVPTVGTDCFLCFLATDPIDSVCFRSAPLSSDNFLTTGFQSSFCRKSSGRFRKISTRILLEIDGTHEN